MTYQKIFLLLLIASLSACGGGGGSSSQPTPNTNNNATTVIINEVSPSNSVFEDDDGDTPDWIELYNPSNNSISLNGWYLTDDLDLPTKWRFPDISIKPHGYQIIFASDKNRLSDANYRSLVKQGDLASYITPTESPAADWTSVNFNDSAWQQGASGFGYGDDDDNTTVENGTSAILIRHHFNLEDVQQIDKLLLDIDYDDGFVAYLNGVEVARSNLAGTAPSPNDFSTVDHEAQLYSGGSAENFDLTAFIDALQQGDNVLAIQVHNVSSTSSDLTAIAYLTARYTGTTNDGSNLTSDLNYSSKGLHTNFKISASSAETIYLSDANQKFVDSIDVVDVPNNMSIGKDAKKQLVYYQKPTPGSANTLLSFKGAVKNIPVFSHQGGLVSKISITISGNGQDVIIRYTRDNTLPTVNSTKYTAAIRVDHNTVIRAAIFKDNFIPSSTVNRTYIVDNTTDLPVTALVTEPGNLFDSISGLYVNGPNADQNYPFWGANFWQDWEKPINVTYYPSVNVLGFTMDMGAKIFGGWSRANPQRSFALYARAIYGNKEIDYPMFENREYSEYKRLVLRNSGNDWLGSMFRDVLMTGLMDGTGVDVQASKPSAVYINGVYWGLYNIREKVDENFIDSRHHVDKDKLAIVERNGETVFGDSRSYFDMMRFVDYNDLSIDANYNAVLGMLDIDNFLNYQIAEIYFDNHDWPGNNIKAWRETGGRWRWILFDTDFGFNNEREWHEANSFDSLSFATEAYGPDWPNPPWATLLLRKLLENNNFKQAFINRFADYLNSRFSTEVVLAAINKHANDIRSEIPAHFNRWSNEAYTKGLRVRDWDTEIYVLEEFARLRPDYARGFIQKYFSLPGTYVLTLNNPQPSFGEIQINGLINVATSTWSGKYFLNNPITLTAIPKPGYQFSHWLMNGEQTQSSITISPLENTEISAVFVAE